MANPKMFFLHVAESLIVNRGDIRNKFDDMVLNYKASDFFNMGIDMGSLISEAALGSEEKVII